MKKKLVEIVLVLTLILSLSAFSQGGDHEKIYIGIPTEFSEEEDAEINGDALMPLAVLDLGINTYREALECNGEEQCFSLFPEHPLEFTSYYRGRKVGKLTIIRELAEGGIHLFAFPSKKYYSGEANIATYPEVKDGIFRKITPDTANQVKLKQIIIRHAKSLFSIKRKNIKYNKHTKYEVTKFNTFYLNAKQTHPAIAATVVAKGHYRDDYGMQDDFAFIVLQYDNKQQRYVPFLRSIPDSTRDEASEEFLDVLDFNNDGNMEIITLMQHSEGGSFRIYSLVNDKYRVVFRGGYVGA